MLEFLGRLESRARADGAAKLSCPTGGRIPDVPGRNTIVTRAGQGCHPIEGVQQGKGRKTWQGEEIYCGNDLIP